VLVLDDRRLRNLPQLVEGGVGQVEPTVTDRQPAVGIIDDSDAIAAVRPVTFLSVIYSQKTYKRDSGKSVVLTVQRSGLRLRFSRCGTQKFTSPFSGRP
jgi:hypothetical protein